jgi:hypothetical protein
VVLVAEKPTDAELLAAHLDPGLLPPGVRRKKAAAQSDADKVRRRAIAQAYAKQTAAKKAAEAAKKKGGSRG